MSATVHQETPRTTRQGLFGDLLVTAATYAVLGVVAAVAWWQLVDLPRATRVGQGVALGPEALGGQVGIDGWFFVLAVVLGAGAGAALCALRRRDPLLMVVLVVLGGGLASLLTTRLGLWLGPPDPQSVLSSRPEGATAPVRLELSASGMAWVWPAAAALGAVLVLWVFAKPEARADEAG